MYSCQTPMYTGRTMLSCLASEMFQTCPLFRYDVDSLSKWKGDILCMVWVDLGLRYYSLRIYCCKYYWPINKWKRFEHYISAIGRMCNKEKFYIKWNNWTARRTEPMSLFFVWKTNLIIKVKHSLGEMWFIRELKNISDI